MWMADNMEGENEPLHVACMDGSYQDVARCLRAGEDVNKHNESGLAPLHLVVRRAAERDDVDKLIDLLVTHKAKVNIQTLKEEDTALHLVAKHCECLVAEDITVRLLEHRADPQLRNRRLRRPYDYAVDKGYVDLSELLSSCHSAQQALKKYRKKRAAYYGAKLVVAVVEGDEDAIAECIRRGADVNFKDKHGTGAIHYVISHCALYKPDVLDELKHAGSDANLTDKDGDTALNLVIKTASLRSDQSMYLLAGKLLEWGTDTNIKDIDGNDAWALAEQKGYEDIKSLLKGYDINAMQLTHSRLQTAILSGSIEVVEASLAAPGADVYERTREGHGPLHLAVLRRDRVEKETIFGMLLQAGLSINDRTTFEHQTALHMAAERGDRLSVGILLRLGIDSQSKDKGGHSAYNLAMRNNHRDVAELIQNRPRTQADREIQRKWKKAAKNTRVCAMS